MKILICKNIGFNIQYIKIHSFTFSLTLSPDGLAFSHKRQWSCYHADPYWPDNISPQTLVLSVCTMTLTQVTFVCLGHKLWNITSLVLLSQCLGSMVLLLTIAFRWHWPAQAGDSGTLVCFCHKFCNMSSFLLSTCCHQWTFLVYRSTNNSMVTFFFGGCWVTILNGCEMGWYYQIFRKLQEVP